MYLIRIFIEKTYAYFNTLFRRKGTEGNTCCNVVFCNLNLSISTYL